MSKQYSDITKVSNALNTEIEAVIAFSKFHSRKAPSPFFTIMSDPMRQLTKDDPYPPEFHYFCNIISVPRQVEIFRFSYFIHVSEVLAQLLNATRKKSLTEAALLFRYYLEVTASFLARVDRIEEVCETVLNKCTKTDDPHDDRFIGHVSLASKELHTLLFPTSIDWKKALNTSVTEDEIREQNKGLRVNKALKKLQKRIPSLPNLYSGCSEIIHPNAIPALTAGEFTGADIDGRAVARVIRFETDRAKLSETYFDVFFVQLVGKTGTIFLQETNSILKEKITALKGIETDLLKTLRPVGRKYLNISLNHQDLDCFEDQLLCPCGSNKTYKKCCGHPRK